MTSHADYMEQSRQISSRSNCASRHVGTLIVCNAAVLVYGYNGVSSRFADCVSAGCMRCSQGGTLGIGYDNCICIHAEQRAIASAAAQGLTTTGARLYSTLRPCLQCLLLIY